MAVRFKRRVAVLVLTLFGFAQASVAFHACAMDRGAMSPALMTGDGKPVSDCDSPMSGTNPVSANLCVLHCTSDLQAAGVAVALVGAPADLPIPAVVGTQAPPTRPTGLLAPPRTPPRRILLHSFLI